MTLIERLRYTYKIAARDQALHGGWGVIEEAAEEIERLRQLIVDYVQAVDCGIRSVDDDSVSLGAVVMRENRAYLELEIVAEAAKGGE